MNDPRLHLYVDAQYLSPYAMSVFVALREKGLDFEMMPVDLESGKQTAPDYARLSLTRRVPTLVHEGFSLSESSAITEYLEERFPETPVYPRDVHQRAKAREVQAWLRSDLAALRQERSTLVVFYGQKSPALTPAGNASVQKLTQSALSLLADGREYLFGEWSIADVDLALMLNRLVLNGDDLPPPLVQYAQRQWQRPSVQAWLNVPRLPLQGQ